MFVFATVGVPLLTLFFSLFQSFLLQRPHVSPPRFAQALARTKPTLSPTPTTVPITATNTPVTPSEAQSLPSITPKQPVQDAIQTYIMQAINQYRASLGLSSVSTNNLTCNFAQIRAEEISSNFSHDGFNQRIQNHTLPYPNYALVTENIAETGDFHNVVAMWKNSPPHAANMRADTPYICVESYDNYYAFEGWKPL